MTLTPSLPSAPEAGELARLRRIRDVSLENIREAREAQAAVREALEQHSVGALPSGEQIIPPFMAEAEVQVKAIDALAARAEQAEAKLAETEKRLAEADAVMAFELSPLDDYRPLDRAAHTRHLREAIARHALRSAATSGKAG